MKKWILGIFGVLGSAFLLLVGLVIYTFSGTQSLQAKTVLSADAVQIKDGFVSVGMIMSGPAEVILVDCGNDSQATAVLNELKLRGLGPEAVKTILITHGHTDHFNGCGMFPQAGIYAMKAEQPLLDGKVGSRSPILGKITPKKPAPIYVSRYLNDGETLTVGTQSISAFFIPGHTDGSVAYLIQGVLYFGDSADSSKDGKLRPAKWFFSNDIEQNHASLRSLAAHFAPRVAEIKMLEFAHSAPLQGVQPLLDFAKQQ